LFFTVATVIIGAVAFSGSIVTFLKLQDLMTSRPVVIPLGAPITLWLRWQPLRPEYGSSLTPRTGYW
jgi:NAD/NADP transhydrogenase beta subunit